MITVICIAIFIFALLSALLFHSSLSLCFIIAGAAAIIAGVNILLRNKLKFIGALAGAACIVLIVFGIFVPSTHTSYGYYDYLGRYEEYTSAMLDENMVKAEMAQKYITEKYGENDMLRYSEGVLALAKGDVSSAESIADSFENKTGDLYFMLRESAIIQKCTSSEELRSNLIPLYQEAVKYHPQWVYMLKNLGCFLFDNEEYAKASYYLLGAYTYSDEIDSEVLLYLGASLIEQGSYERGLTLLDETLEYDSSDEMKNAVLYYAQKAGFGGDS